MSHLETLQRERDEAIAGAKAIVDAAEKAGRPFTDDEARRVADLTATAKAKAAEHDRAEQFMKTADEVADLLGGGKGIEYPTGAGVSAQRYPIGARLFNGDTGDDYDGRRKALITPSESRAGNVSATLRDATGATIVPLAEVGCPILSALPGIDWTSPAPGTGDEYKIRRQSARGDNGAAVAAGSTKPTSTYSFELVTDRTRTFAALSQAIKEQDLADIPDLAAAVGDELGRRCLHGVEDALLNGDEDDATSDDFDGILNATGTKTQAFATDALTTIRTAVTTLQTSGFVPGAVILAASDWQTIELSKDSEGRPVFAGQFGNVVKRSLFGVPVIISAYLDAGKAVVADLTQAVVTVRDEIKVSWTDGGSDLFDKNQRKFRAELRVGFNVLQPSAFVVCTLTDSEA